jgi:Methylase involved in ubiquinone/menaquinone biosynthesis
MIAKRALGSFLARNPFAHGWTEGLFYREKMRAIHRVAPAQLPQGARILEIGGGRSGLAAALYPEARIVTLDIDPSLATPDDRLRTFVCGDARALPFGDAEFDVVTLFDVLEHIEEDHLAAREAMRVTRPGGHVLVSTPRHDWHYPYHGFMGRFCPPEQSLMDEWGHVRRGYTNDALAELFGRSADSSATFINAGTAFYHDVAFSRLSPLRRKLLYAIAAVPTAIAYARHKRSTPGTETAFAWQI